MSGRPPYRSASLVDRALLAAPAEIVAPRVLGLLLVTDEVVGRIVEVEASGPHDPASHSARGERPGNATMFREAGRFYVYVSYGIHQLGNIAVDQPGVGAAVLLRGLEVLDGHDVASARRAGRRRPRELAAGPGRLSHVLALDRQWDDGTDLLAPDNRVTLRDDGTRYGADEIAVGPRTGVSVAADVPWRWWVRGSAGVSPYRRHPRAALATPPG